LVIKEDKPVFETKFVVPLFFFLSFLFHFLQN
jgi:hypothetical protein